MPTVEVSIAAHHVPARAAFLETVLTTIAGWRLDDVRVTIVSNTDRLAEEGAVAAGLAALANSGKKADLEIVEGLDHPFHLTWHHKARLAQWSEETGARDDLFVYLEDDIAVSDANIRYILATYPLLREKRLIPGLIRYETFGRELSTDFPLPQIVTDDDLIDVAGQRFVIPEFPYWAGFAVDRASAREYLRSDWMRIDAVELLPQLPAPDCRAQSAFGPAYVGLDEGRHSRFAIAVDGELKPLRECRVWHCADNYAPNPASPFGKIEADRIFLRPALRSRLERQAIRLRQRMRRTVASLRSLHRPR